jgi:hypothetical protein
MVRVATACHPERERAVLSVATPLPQRQLPLVQRPSSLAGWSGLISVVEPAHLMGDRLLVGHVGEDLAPVELRIRWAGACGFSGTRVLRHTGLSGRSMPLTA